LKNQKTGDIRRKQEKTQDVFIVNQNGVDIPARVCYKYPCAFGAFPYDFSKGTRKSKAKYIIINLEENTMSTFMANKANIERKWYVVDAAGKPLGKTAVIVADLLRGKGKVTYTPHADCGDNVIVINAGKAVLTGNKLEQKYYRTHSGWIGGLKETKYRILMQDKPELAMRVAVRGMMPRNTVTKDSLKRLHIYAGDTHEHQAQKPELVK